MADPSIALQCYSFEIPNGKVNGPMNLVETLLSAQTCEPEWLREGSSFTDVEILNGTPVKYSLNQIGSLDDFKLKVQVITRASDGRVIEGLGNHLEHVLGLKDDLNFLYRKFADEEEPLFSTFTNLRGLRLMRGTDLYQALICSILSQNNSVKLWNRTARLMMQHYGRKVCFPDGSSSFLFPDAEVLAKINPRELRSRTSMGYRAKPVVVVSRMIVKGELDLGTLAKEPYENAMESLLALPGVGPKVADCFLLYGAGHLEAAPVDVWIHRIVSKLYFGNKKVSRLKTARFLRDRFREWAGYAQLYLFDYARRIDPAVQSPSRAVPSAIPLLDHLPLKRFALQLCTANQANFTFTRRVSPKTGWTIENPVEFFADPERS
jgi:N-glycosylase/DNA lyase